jgi:hypothetical protein
MNVLDLNDGRCERVTLNPEVTLFVAVLWAVIFVDVRPAFAGSFQSRLRSGLLKTACLAAISASRCPHLLPDSHWAACHARIDGSIEPLNGSPS